MTIDVEETITKTFNNKGMIVEKVVHAGGVQGENLQPLFDMEIIGPNGTSKHKVMLVFMVIS